MTPERTYHNNSVQDVVSCFESSMRGLSSREAHQRLEQSGPNEIEAPARISVLRILLQQFQSFIVYILLFAVTFSMLLGEYVDAIVILIILLANTIIGFFQEYGAERSLEALTQMNIVQARVYRDGGVRVVHSGELVPGDVIDLTPGDQVPADARILSQNGLMTDESNLTGESLPVHKHAETIAGEPDLPVSERRNMIYSSTIASAGKAKALVTATGMDTEIGKIARMVDTATGGRPRTPLQQRLDTFGRRLGFAVIAVCWIVFAAMLAKSMASPGASFSFQELDLRLIAGFALVAVSLAVAAVPTALPTIVTVALSIGVKRLLQKNALVRRLSSVETLGNCDIICTDKTGTLTCNQMTVRSVFSLDGALENLDQPAHDSRVRHALEPVFRIGRVCNDASENPNADASRDEDIYSGNPTEVALMHSADRAGLTSTEVERLAERPFDNDRKLMSVMVRDPGGPRTSSSSANREQSAPVYVYVKGAADRLLERCTYARVDDRTVLLTPELRERIEVWQEEQATQALRVLAFAYRDLTSDHNTVDQTADIEPYSEDNLIFAGLQAMYDPPRPEVTESIRQCREAGIRVIMITGDYKETARAIGRQIGLEIPETGGVLTGRDLDRMDAPELEKNLRDDQINIFARVSPEHKLRIVTALQKLGHTVAMTGDGVNDSPALKRADIGVAIGSGTAVAREAGDFVLLDDSFTSIVEAVYEGRGIYDNIQKSIMLLLSGNLGEVLIIFVAVMSGMSLPLTAIMLLWINLITDGAPALAFSVDPYGKDIMRRKALPGNSGILPRPRLALLLYLGCVGTGLALILFAIYGGHRAEDGQGLDRARTMVFNFIVLYEILLVFIIRAEYKVPFFKNRWLWFAVLLSIALQAMILYSPLQIYFGTVPPGVTELVYAGAGGILFLGAYAFYRAGRRWLARWQT